MAAAGRQLDDAHAAAQRGLMHALHPDPQRFADWARAHAEAVDWAWIVHNASGHKVAALLAARVEACGLGEIVGATLNERLADIRRDAAARATMAEQTLARLVQAYEAADIPCFVVKGSVLAHQVYGDARLRRFADVDVVVRRGDVERAEAVLRRLCYLPGGIEEILATPPKPGPDRELAHDLTRRFHARRLAAFSWYAPRGSGLLAVDLHWHIAPARLRVGEDALWRETTVVRVGATAVRTLTPPATVIHLAAHATTCLFSGFRLMHLADVGWAAGCFAEHGAATWRLAEQWGVRAHLARVFDTLERVLEVRVPFAAAGAAPRRRAWAAGATSAAVLLDAPRHKTLPLRARLWPELRWSIAMGCARRNVTVIAAVSWARLRFTLARRQRPAA